MVKSKKIMLTGCFAVYLLAVLWYTLGKRAVGYYPGQFVFFQSYQQWFGGMKSQGYAIIANIAMFVPFGFLMPIFLQRNKSRALLFTFFLALAFSSLIETAQYVLMRGFFEFDDIFNNVLGAVSGVLLFRLLRRLVPEKCLPAVLSAAGTGIVLICVCLFFFPGGDGSGSMKQLSQGLCFQVEKASLEKDGLHLSGVCFWYEREVDYSIVLQSTQTGEKLPLRTERGLPRPDVNNYFRCGRDYTDTGFEAVCQDIQKDEEYEILLDFGLLRVFPTGVYLAASGQRGTAVDLHYVPSAEFKPLNAEGTYLTEIAEKGILRAYNPEHHVYIYWLDGSLYWIAGEGFQFRENQKTRLELMLWTTQPERLPQNRRDAGVSYDLWGVSFESNELAGDLGPYRVCAIALPTDYSLTAISTGRYSGGWIWQETFWPVFRFSGSLP